ncbi:hypothetical protein [Bacillus niameyensis]|uniref:hypothetical protein n=1 Tax=Bacillus niameyensis TaxID=1522308 RepID=UPI000A74CD4C|nr:hypothetical protein [Bacillus niameyensis]
MNHPAIDRGFIYVHMNHANQFVISSGIEFSHFLQGIPSQPSNILLLRHNFEDGHFNMHTMLDYVEGEMINKLASEDVYSYGDFCWIDFSNEENVNHLTGQEIAEILYLGHLKEHLKLPFYRKLNNQFVYLAHDDGWFNKTYYQNWDHFYTMLGAAVAEKVNFPREITFFNRWKKKSVPAVPAEILHPFISHMKEGILFSIDKSVRNRLMIEIPVWVIGDYYDMDAMLEEGELLMETKKPDGKIVLDRKTGEWQALANYSSK